MQQLLSLTDGENAFALKGFTSQQKQTCKRLHGKTKRTYVYYCHTDLIVYRGRSGTSFSSYFIIRQIKRYYDYYRPLLVIEK